MNQVTSEAILRQSRGEPASQAAGVEHSRAIAEVQAAFVVARQNPREPAKALRNAIDSCRTVEVASQAFYKFKRGNETISDASIHLATELARCWGNINYGIMELARDDVARMSEMLAYAIDLETNTMARQSFLVPHIRDTKSGPRVLVDMRDIYENNANNGARRLREAIFRVLPPYLKEQAKSACRDTLEKGGSTPLPVRIAEAIAGFGRIGISQERLEAKHGPSAQWTGVDLANLEIAYTSIRRQEISAEEEFPRVGTEETADKARQIAEQQRGSKPSVASEPGITVQSIIDRAAAAVSIDQMEAIEADYQTIAGNVTDDEASTVDAALNNASRRIHIALKETPNG